MGEAAEQAQVVQWLHRRGWLFTATANGVAAGPAAWRALARSGVSPGVPDLLVFEPRKGYVGVALEMKASGGRPSIEQLRWQEALQARGWLALTVYGAEEAIAVLEGLG